LYSRVQDINPKIWAYLIVTTRLARYLRLNGTRYHKTNASHRQMRSSLSIASLKARMNNIAESCSIINYHIQYHTKQVFHRKCLSTYLLALLNYRISYNHAYSIYFSFSLATSNFQCKVPGLQLRKLCSCPCWLPRPCPRLRFVFTSESLPTSHIAFSPPPASSDPQISRMAAMA
jgi:hypothetical protein